MGGQLYNCEHFRFSGCSIRDCGENVLFLDGINSDNLWDDSIPLNGRNVF